MKGIKGEREELKHARGMKKLFPVDHVKKEENLLWAWEKHQED
jgi:hypothetical protein